MNLKKFKIEYASTKNHYGPSLPSGSAMSKSKKRSSSRDSKSPSKEKISKIYHEKKSGNYDSHDKHEYRRQSSSQYSKHNDTNKREKKSDKEIGNNSDDEEDLEAFYNQLKQKKASLSKKK